MTICSVLLDQDFLDLIDQAYLEGQIDGETMELIYVFLSRDNPETPQS